ncbi:MAG TPA: putative sugar nucleotidyl transferase [Sediminibacterium sp.]|nr:putative sugar nucleotidyl transferase [Sediminibacterium sp.]
MAVILFDPPGRNGLLPLSATRALADLRMGMLTIRERWQYWTGQEIWVQTVPYLQPLYSFPPADSSGDFLWVDASLLPDEQVLSAIRQLQAGEALRDQHGCIAAVAPVIAGKDHREALQSCRKVTQIKEVSRIRFPWELVQWNDQISRTDFRLLVKQNPSVRLPDSVNIIEPDQVFMEPGARLAYCTLNAATGPIYIARDAEVMEGTTIRGPFYLGPGSVVKMNSRIYGATSIGPFCLAGGEIKNSILTGYSNKAHDGYLGDTIVGAWCNIGAGSTNSNIKNTAGPVKVWDFHAEKYRYAGTKCGMIMGDYSRIAINSAINTGTVIGMSANVFGEGLLPTIIPSFSWGVKGVRYEFDKALEAIDNWKKLKQQNLMPQEKEILQYIFQHAI